MTATRVRSILAGVGTIGLLALSAGAATASGQSGTTHDSFPAAGAVFTCNGEDITVQSGMVDEVLHWNLDAQGVFHLTGTIVPQDVTLTDGSGGTYWLSGSSWFGGKGTDPEAEPALFTETDHFVLHSDTGANLKVQIVTHASSDGKSFTFDRGSCEPPMGD